MFCKDCKRITHWQVFWNRFILGRQRPDVLKRSYCYFFLNLRCNLMKATLWKISLLREVGWSWKRQGKIPIFKGWSKIFKYFDVWKFVEHILMLTFSPGYFEIIIFFLNFLKLICLCFKWPHAIVNYTCLFPTVSKLQQSILLSSIFIKICPHSTCG